MLNYASDAFLMSPYKFSIGLSSGDWAGHSNSILFPKKTSCCLITGVFQLGNNPKHTFQEHFLFSIGKNNLFKYLNVFELIHDTWLTINRPNTTVGETSTCNDFCTTISRSLHSIMRLYFWYLVVVWYTVDNH